jgi:hypothetical protein
MHDERQQPRYLGARDARDRRAVRVLFSGGRKRSRQRCAEWRPAERVNTPAEGCVMAGHRTHEESQQIRLERKLGARAARDDPRGANLKSGGSLSAPGFAWAAEPSRCTEDCAAGKRWAEMAA